MYFYHTIWSIVSANIIGEDLYLKYSDEGLREAVKSAAGFGLVGKIKLASKHLHAQEGEDDNEEEEKQQQAGNGANWVQ